MSRQSVFIAAFSAIALFVAASYVVRLNEESIVGWVRAGGMFSVAAYIFFAVLSSVVPPATNLFLIPVGAAAWGVAATGVLNVIGWGGGSVIAFLLARHFGERLRVRFPKLFEIPHVEALVSKRHPFLSLIFLRMTFAVDVLSYALGFFTTVSLRMYALSLVGIIPFSFLLPYLSRLPGKAPLYAGSAAFTAFLVYAFIRLRYFKESQGESGERGSK